MRKALVITDFDTAGSGYRNICAPLFTELAKKEYDIKIIGLANRGEEHYFPFAIIPCTGVEEIKALSSNFIQMWQPDVVIVALDLSLQILIIPHVKQYQKPYIVITPLENGPLAIHWAMPLFNVDGVFFISELGKQEALKMGIKAEHLQIGVDSNLWRPAFAEEKKKIREGLGIPQDAFVILTVADNQERKNLWAAFRAIRKLKKMIERPIRYILVTREQSPFGWNLRSLAVTEEINDEYFPFERGMSQKDLWGLYAVSDVYVQPSKAEGLGLPVMDAMCCKIPVVATHTGAMMELLANERGMLVSGYEFDSGEHFFIDVWGNSDRVMINIDDLRTYLWNLAHEPVFDTTNMVNDAYEFITQRTWDIPAKQLDDKITEILSEQKPQPTQISGSPH